MPRTPFARSLAHSHMYTVLLLCTHSYISIYKYSYYLTQTVYPMDSCRSAVWLLLGEKTTTTTPPMPEHIGMT